MSGLAWAQIGAVNAGDTAWMLVSSALVLLMVPGLALFYGGLVRRKNVLSTIMHSFFGLALVSVVWVIVGFSIAFAPDATGTGLFGGLDFVMFNNVGLEPASGSTIPFVLFAAFQLMFAAITPALITGAFAERKRFASFVIFTVLWSVFVYSPIAHWVWASDGWLYQLGALDFARRCGAITVGVTSNPRSPLARRFSSTVPALRPRGPMVSCHGRPIRSMSANFAPARSSRSS